MKMAIIKRQTIIGTGEYVERLKPIYITPGNAKWCSYIGKQFSSFSNGYRVTIWPTPRHIPKRNENIHPQKHLYKNVYSSVIHNHQEVGTTQMSLNRGIEKKCGTFTQWHIIQPQTRISTDFAVTWINLKNLMLKYKAVTKINIYYDFMYMNCPEKANLHRWRVD